jgi:hypothetical protein
MQKITFGKTNLLVTPLGFGTAQIGFLPVSKSESDKLLNGVLDNGINVIDTAACYGNAEEKIGEAISIRRDEYVLITKCGHQGGDCNFPEWSPELIRFNAERSLKRMRTDRLDVLLLHSCSKDHLHNDKLINALGKCKKDGLTHFIGYSGDDVEAQLALTIDVFDCLETSVNICDQQVLQKILPVARSNNLGVFAKRPLANTCWRDLSNYGSYQDYAQIYTNRLKAMGITPESLNFDGDWVELAIRFTVFQPGVHSALIGGKNLKHIESDINLLQKGPLPKAILQKIQEIWKEKDDGSWIGQN